ncbi:MAG: hypothetical protein JWQ42_435 [Edaphobacter sp.]|nr:hypothetical protein [Edaphobacter sp.]
MSYSSWPKAVFVQHYLPRYISLRVSSWFSHLKQNEQIGVVAGACNAPNLLYVPFSLGLIRPIA